MVVLAYQLCCVDSKSRGFILLDAKHTTPWTLEAWLAKSPDWEAVGRGDGGASEDAAEEARAVAPLPPMAMPFTEEEMRDLGMDPTAWI